MTPRLASAAGLAIAGSLALHLAGFAGFGNAPPVPQTDGGGSAEMALLGSSFADMVQGSASMPDTPPVQMPVETSTAEQTETADPTSTAPVPTDTPTEAATVDSLALSAPPDDDPVLPLETAERTPPAAAPTPARTTDATAALQTTSARVDTTAPAPPAEQHPLPPVSDLSATPAPAPARIVSTAPQAQQPDASTPRPQARPSPEPEPEPPAIAASAPSAAGNASRNTRRGDVSGREAGQSAAQAPAREGASQAGSAAAANYPGLVMRQIAQTRRNRVSARGEAQVSFTISGNGGLQSISITRSSGNAELDQSALDHVRRASPFPPPPAGATRNFSIRIEGRG
ncbi:TonB family protein [Rhodophyticola sp. CCM32]|uniref:energy transducer TonB family protein n=1 Tax=Rhodophyticola sp. CCM32 TaxID=2916397 RepID=UPI00107F839D|nr:energy transducer TonB [Rhodophyticola sp. CCM32]QBY01485.1 TonB family protein [Rhodophyticola sp. CCM32]